MTPTATPSAASAAPRADALLAAYQAAGYARAQPGILQAAEPFLDLSGEDIRKSLLLTTDMAGNDLCLRPDLTIPVARDYLASPLNGQRAGLCYLGPVFRAGDSGAQEILQAGIESFGRDDRAAADADMLALGLEATKAFGVASPDIRIGDVGLFAALIEALDLAPVWKRRLVKDFNRKISLAQDLDTLTLSAAPAPEYQGVLTALAGSDRKAALALVSDLMSIAGASAVGGRTVSEIADRFLEQSTLGSAKLPAEARALIEKFLAIAGTPAEALTQLRALASGAGLALDVALKTFEERMRFIEARGIAPQRLRFATAFGRGLDYYTGFEFELHAPGSTNGPLVAGGRYDDLLTRLGSPKPIPAVGFSVWIAALANAGGVR